MSPGDAGDWIADVYGRLATECGYRPDEIDALTFEDVEPIFAHWKRHPPLRFLAAAWMGFKPPDDDKREYMTAEGAKHLKRLLDGSGIGRAS
jgi:hypothetical protein